MDPAHTLAGVLTRLQRDRSARADPELARKLDAAFAKHVGALGRLCARELRGFSAAEVEELVQDVLAEAWAKLPEYRPDQRFRAFLFRIATLKCANARRKRRDFLSEDGLVDPASPERSVLLTLSDRERDALVGDALAAVLDPSDRQIAHLRWVLDFPLEDIAEQVGLPSPPQVSDALKRCKRRLEKEVLRRLAERRVGPSWLRREES